MFQIISDMMGFNQSMFSGAMDIIVVRKPNGDLSSSSFHVRFGSLKILQSKDKVIEIYINGNKTPVQMRLSSSGDAYFLCNEEDLSSFFSPSSSPSPLIAKSVGEQIDNSNNNNNSEEVMPKQDNIDNILMKNTKNSSVLINMRSGDNEIQLNNSKIWISNSHKEILENIDKVEEIFSKNVIPKEEFFNDPWAVLNNKNTVFLINDTLYNSQAAIPIIMSLILYNESLPIKKISELTFKTGIKYSFTRRESINEISRIKVPNIGDDYINKTIEMNKTQKGGNKPSKNTKTLFPTSNQLKSLKLQNGRNEICFVCKSSMSGTQSLKAEIYLWSSDSKIIISDIDGTITKSDILGQIMPMIGSDWNHPGITELFTNIAKNKYKFIYLTARAICQSQSTRDYLISLFQEKNSLPVGPMLMSPDGLFSSFKREAIDKSPHLLKISTLTEIRALFHKDYCPFYSGFGNRETDAIAYRSVGIELSKIFIINTKGEIIQLNNSIKKTYSLINTIVADLFPVISSVQEKDIKKEEEGEEVNQDNRNE